MKSLEESVVTAMDGSDSELVDYLPYIVQDLWEMGADPEVVIQLVRMHTKNHTDLQVLDLGCGKGAVSIKLAAALKCRCFGVDAMEEFIKEARGKAVEFGVESLCRFEVNDIRTRAKALANFDVIVLGAIGPVFGDCHAMLTVLAKCLKQKGLIVWDDGYIEDHSDFTHPLIQKKELVVKQIAAAGMQVLDEIVMNQDERKDSDTRMYESIKKRCEELIIKHPEKSKLFLDYMNKQEEENDVLETKIVCSTLLIGKK